MCLSGPDKQEASQSERSLTRLARSEARYWKEHFIPLENDAIEDVKKAGSTAKKKAYRGKAHTASMRGMALPTGIDPNSGAAKSSTVDRGTAVGRIAADGSTKADLEAENTQKGMGLNLVAYGRGQSQRASSNLKSSAVRESAVKANETRLTSQKKSALWDAVGTAAGTAIGMKVGGSGEASGEGFKGAPVHVDGMDDHYNVPNTKTRQAV